MSAGKRTPGPWQAKRLATFAEPGWVVLWPAMGGQHMRRLDHLGNFTEADARLVAASLDLLRLAEREAGLSPNAGGIGAGMLASLVEEARIAVARTEVQP